MPSLTEIAGIEPEGENDPLEPHMLIGDSNLSAWKELYEEWRCDTFLWQLTDPGCPTHDGGGALDRILIRLAAYMPGDSPHTQGKYEGDKDERTEGALHPAKAPLTIATSDRYPVLLALPWRKVPNGSLGAQLIQGGLTPEGRGKCDDRPRRSLVRESLQDNGDNGVEMEPINLDSLYSRLERLAWQAIADRSTRRREAVAARPRRTFQMRRAAQPKMVALQAALENGLHRVADGLIHNISAVGWRGFLETVHRSTTKALRKILTDWLRRVGT